MKIYILRYCKGFDYSVKYVMGCFSSFEKAAEPVISKGGRIFKPEDMVRDGFEIEEVELDKIDGRDSGWFESSIYRELEDIKEIKKIQDQQKAYEERKARGEYCIFDSEFWEKYNK